MLRALGFLFWSSYIFILSYSSYQVERVTEVPAIGLYVLLFFGWLLGSYIILFLKEKDNIL